ncbi:MAG: 16S rRNA (guanine(527)-N(7))-methyltransferase RsmG [Pseudomonadota bacterium]
MTAILPGAPADQSGAPAYTPDQLASALSLNGKTMDRLKRFDQLLVDTNKVHNLVARSTIEARWFRHFLDSAQLFSFLRDEDEMILDMGAGAGFPGLVLAAMSAPDRQFILVESIAKKARFLHKAKAAMGLSNVTVETARVEGLTTLPLIDVIMARALAPLTQLLAYAEPLCAGHTRLVFPKGARLEEELTEARKAWHIQCFDAVSMTSDDARILIIDQMRRAR